MKNRSSEKEILDLGSSFYSLEEYHQCLEYLDRIGRYLGGDQASYRAFDSLPHSPESILDVGCGGGGFTFRLAQKYPKARVLGIDTSKDAIEFAKTQLQNSNVGTKNIEFSFISSPDLDFSPHSFDIVTSTLVCHHMNDDELVHFLKKAYKVAKRAVILNDLHRHPLAYAGYGLIAPIFFNNRLIIHDGLLSIKRSFIRRDWITLLSKAEIPLENCKISWHWAFRWIVFITPSN
jgi:2-polyprenyl-3-methyl-5-hydroxy-6-metoxy-1,4-benzoquinol methylase